MKILLFLFPAALLGDALLKIADAFYASRHALLLQPPKRRTLRQTGAVGGAIFAAGVCTLTLGAPLPSTAKFILSLFLILISLTDWEQRLISDRVLLACAAAALLSSPWLAASPASRALGALAGGIVMLALSLVSRGGIGGGDIKLLFVLGLWLGLEALPCILLTGFLSGGLAAAFLLAVRRKRRGDYFAYGPYFAIGAFLYLLVVYRS